ncbi:MAG TPA: SAM-dependent chlorinase/fluorinase, partial [Ktedonobacteraceae bacterium]|nr:SAM-dependent chlorinase/fluorinase [Ktedonobacteraceae bacterium]
MTQQNFVNLRPVIALMTDFGIGDGDVGVMKGVIAGITPEAHIIDITHNVGPQNVPSGAWILAAAYRYFPKNTVFVCVVDPGVGSTRGAIALHAGDWYFVGPDNGLFSYVMSEQPVHSSVLLSNTTFHLPIVSSTFHGRDIFAPVGAHLARGLDNTLFELGPSVNPAELRRLEVGGAVREGTTINAHIVHVDNFGNLITSIALARVPELYTVSQVKISFKEIGVTVDKLRQFFAEGPDDGQAFIFGDSSGYVGVAVRNGNAAKTLGVGLGAPLSLILSEA